MTIDSIRYKAHRVASSVGDGANYNPFARQRSRSQSDIENQVHRTRSEAQVQPAIEEQRRGESRQTEKDFPPPPHADTAPAVSPTSARADHSLAHATEKDFAATNGAPNKQSTDISDMTAVNGNGPGVHKRAKFKNLFHKNHDADEDVDADAHLQRADSEELTLEERRRKALKKKIPVGQQFRAVILGSWINVLLIFVPIGFAMYYSKKVGAVPIFIVNFVAIIPLAAMLSYATEELALRVGETFGGLLNATFGYVCTKSCGAVSSQSNN